MRGNSLPANATAQFFVGLRRLRRGFSPLLNLPRQDYAALHPQFWFSIAPFPRELSISEKTQRPGTFSRTGFPLELMAGVPPLASWQGLTDCFLTSAMTLASRASKLKFVSRPKTQRPGMFTHTGFPLELMTGFEPVTYALPRRCATTCATSATLIVYHTRSQMSIPQSLFCENAQRWSSTVLRVPSDLV